MLDETQIYSAEVVKFVRVNFQKTIKPEVELLIISESSVKTDNLTLLFGVNVPENYIVLDMQTEQRLFMVTQVDDDAFDIMAKNERIFLKLLESKKEFSIGGIKQ